MSVMLAAEQELLAKAIGSSFPPETPHVVAAAILCDQAAATLLLAGRRSYSDAQYEYLERLCAEVGMDAPTPISPAEPRPAERLGVRRVGQARDSARGAGQARSRCRGSGSAQC
ncbi:hypothetical protein OG264_00515 [Streptomyces xanthophaeus]|uniref:hypothetical protein n=1 Tax=Streptomyces xanthophaeus TaxID=67385 RepID=UPI003869C0B5|nr:hypothetical protein OG264_00515 [Streptomyces xanthophaeus]WST64909.1 hypothetical protein OG605_37845 [Streptomyces xanthophaeus]